MAYELAWEPHGVALRFSGQISFNDIRDASVGYQSDPRFDGLRYVIADYSDVSGCDAAPGEMDYLWAVDLAAGVSNPRIRQAYVATSPTVIALAMRYMTQEVCAFPTEVFSSLVDARRWLEAEARTAFPPSGLSLLCANRSSSG